MRSVFFLLLQGLLAAYSFGQTNIHCTSPAAEMAMRGQYDPALYYPSNPVSHPDSVVAAIVNGISADSLHLWLSRLSSFHNRNSGSDTLSSTRGIGAAQRWIHSKFQQFSAEHENRLLPAYLQFDRPFCAQTRHKDVIAVLPGTDTADKRILLVEAHLDSRCYNSCDTGCVAYGADDNGSGCALVIEMARVMSGLAMNHTVVFMLTTGEEQGLYGAEAFVDYVNQQDIALLAVFNNDIVGGVYCGNTASFPGCSPAGAADTVNVRLFSFGGFNSPHKQMARYIKLQYKERIQSAFTFPTLINIMAPEDRSGRSGDHIPFRQQGHTAIRLTSAFEHGHGDPTAAGYADRQHTSGDSLGIDLDVNGSLDSFYIDFNYLRRNAVINANAMAMAALNGNTPDFDLAPVPAGAEVSILPPFGMGAYRIGVRSVSNDWDSVYSFVGLSDTITGLQQGTTYIFSVASVDYAGVTSPFSREEAFSVPTSVGAQGTGSQIFLMQNEPNPFDEETRIGIWVKGSLPYGELRLRITTPDGRHIEERPLQLHEGMNEVNFDFSAQPGGVFFYSLLLAGEALTTRKMVTGR